MLFVALLVLANLVFIARSARVALNSRVSLQAVNPRAALPALSIVVPARNEARNIERCVRSLFTQRYPALEVIVVDDGSTDATRSILAALQDAYPSLRVIDGAPLPDGWVGKPWAITQGVRAASGEVLLFTDADTIHEPLAAASAVAFLCDRRCDALSLLTEQIMGSIGERLALPGIVWTIAYGTGPLDEVNDPRKTDTTIFNGQYVLIRRAIYERIGGHAAVRGEIAEDLELARLLKREGYRTMLIGAGDLVRTRMYRSFSELWEGFVKNFALGFRGRPWLALVAIAFFACISPVTPLALLGALLERSWAEAAPLAAVLLAAIGIVTVGLRRFRFPWWAGLTLHLGLAAMLGILTTSLVRHATGSVTWRGRRY